MKKRPPSYETQELREFAEVLQGRRTISLFLQTPVPDELVRWRLRRGRRITTLRNPGVLFFRASRRCRRYSIFAG